jgi:hypothetical protein
MARAKLVLLSDSNVLALFDAMGERVAKVLAAIGEAQTLQASGEQHEAVARLDIVDSYLQDAIALHRAVVIVHYQE